MEQIVTQAQVDGAFDFARKDCELDVDSAVCFADWYWFEAEDSDGSYSDMCKKMGTWFD